MPNLHTYLHGFYTNKPFPSFPGPLYQNEVKCSAFDVEMIFHSHANKTYFHKKGCALGLILKKRVFGTRKWPVRIILLVCWFAHDVTAAMFNDKNKSISRLSELNSIFM